MVKGYAFYNYTIHLVDGNDYFSFHDYVMEMDWPNLLLPLIFAFHRCVWAFLPQPKTTRNMLVLIWLDLLQCFSSWKRRPANMGSQRLAWSEKRWWIWRRLKRKEPLEENYGRYRITPMEDTNGSLVNLNAKSSAYLPVLWPLVFHYTWDATRLTELAFKLEASKSSKGTWLARKHVVACVIVCKSWKDMIVKFIEAKRRETKKEDRKVVKGFTTTSCIWRRLKLNEVWWTQLPGCWAKTASLAALWLPLFAFTLAWVDI